MKNSMNSMSRSSAVSFPDEAELSPEESSWTMYFEDFVRNNNNEVMDEENSSFCSDVNYQTSSLVSDAACSATTRHAFGGCNKKLSFKKRKKKDINKGTGLVEDDLEDTACSPVNSPKVCNLVNHFGKNMMKQKDGMNICQEKGSGSGQMDERNDVELGLNIEREDIEGTNELNKRGLCLVPLSMVAHYLG